MWSDLSQEVFEGPQNTMWKILGKENNTILRLLIFSFVLLCTDDSYFSQIFKPLRNNRSKTDPGILY